MSKHYHIVMTKGGWGNDYFSWPYATRSEARDALMFYVQTDFDEETGMVNWNHVSDDCYVDGEARVEVKTCDHAEQFTGLSATP